MNLPVVRGLMKGGMVVLFGIIVGVVVEVVFVAFDSKIYLFVETKPRNHAFQN